VYRPRSSDPPIPPRTAPTGLHANDLVLASKGDWGLAANGHPRRTTFQSNVTLNRTSVPFGPPYLIRGIETKNTKTKKGHNLEELSIFSAILGGLTSLTSKLTELGRANGP
jgi:hypothetical protein